MQHVWISSFGEFRPLKNQALWEQRAGLVNQTAELEPLGWRLLQLAVLSVLVMVRIDVNNNARPTHQKGTRCLFLRELVQTLSLFSPQQPVQPLYLSHLIAVTFPRRKPPRLTPPHPASPRPARHTKPGPASKGTRSETRRAPQRSGRGHPRWRREPLRASQLFLVSCHVLVGSSAALSD